MRERKKERKKEKKNVRINDPMNFTGICCPFGPLKSGVNVIQKKLSKK